MRWEVSRFTLDVRNVARSTFFDSIRFDSIAMFFLEQWIYIYRTGMLDNRIHLFGRLFAESNGGKGGPGLGDSFRFQGQFIVGPCVRFTMCRYFKGTSCSDWIATCLSYHKRE